VLQQLLLLMLCMPYHDHVDDGNYNENNNSVYKWSIFYCSDLDFNPMTFTLYLNLEIFTIQAHMRNENHDSMSLALPLRILH